MGLGWAQILLVRHLWVLKTPQDQSGLGSAQNDGVASALALQSPFQMVQFVPVHLQHTNKEAFITQRHAGAAWPSVTAISVLARPPGGGATCPVWGLLVHEVPAGCKFGLQCPYFPQQVSHDVEG